jgi:cytochrome c-type biogenesis protein CcmH/NrfF
MRFGLVLRILVALLGVACVTVGFFLWFVPLGFIVVGCVMVFVMYAWQYFVARAGVDNEVS